MTAHLTEPLLGRGIYDVDEIARLVRRRPHEVTTWASASTSPLLLPRSRRVFSFHDLVTAEVVAELRRRCVSVDRIRSARQWLYEELRVPWPLAHAAGLKRLASVGNSVYYREQELGWLDVSEGGQQPFVEVIRPLLREVLEFDRDGMASAWRPASGILLRPDIQAGAPCLEGTRLTTELLADLEAQGEDPEDMAADYDVDIALVRLALEYEHALAA